MQVIGIVILGAILLVLCVMLWVLRFGGEPNKKTVGPFSEGLMDRIEKTKAEGEELKALTVRINKKYEAPPAEIQVSSGGNGEELISTKNIKAGRKMLIPLHLTEEEKAVLKDFYNL